MTLLDEFLAQARTRLGADPTEVLVTPRAMATLTVKGVSVPAVYDGVPFRCVPPEGFGSSGDHQRVAIVVVDDQITQALRLVQVP